MPTRRGWIWTLWSLWALFLLVVLITSQIGGISFGCDNLRRLAPFAIEVGNRLCDLFEAVGLDFSSIRAFYNDMHVYASGTTSFMTALVIVGTWTAVTWVIAWVVARLLGHAGDRKSVAANGFWR